MRNLIVIPTYNEKENLPTLVQRLASLEVSLEALVVDDNSPDGTGQVADELASHYPWIKVLHRPGKAGLGSAYVDGFRYAIAQGYDIIGGMDADLSHDPAYLPAMLDALHWVDFVVGSRYVQGGEVRNWGTLRRLMSRGGNLYSRTILRVAVHDLTAGFKLFRREVLQSLDLDSIRSNGYSFLIETTYRALKRGFKVTEMPIVFEDRRSGRSKLSRAVVVEAMLMIPRLRLTA